ncbi:MAG: class I SAM-dependent methyltransferase, partial [Thermoplasmata archaeon]|nr:class I SAM-dependent methyltransferase [Thermoplasmata archaeon]
MLGSRLRRWQVRRLLRRALPFVRAVRDIADLGAGTGADAEEFHQLCASIEPRRYLLLDAQRAMLEAGQEHRRRHPADAVHARPLLGDVTRLPLKDGSCHVVLSIGLLCCVEDEAIP